MKKMILTLGVLFLMVGMVSAVDCASYFTKAADKRIKVVSASSSLELTVDRMNSRVQTLYNTLDDLNNDQNLTEAADDFTELNDRKNDASQDVSDLKSAIDNYDNAISDSRSDLPNTCYSYFRMYDGDLGDVQDYYDNVKRYWNKFTPKYDIINGYRSHLTTTLVSEAKPKVDDLTNYIDDLYSEVGNGIAFDLNGSIAHLDEKIYNQSECFGMIKKNVDIATKDCQSKCNAYVATLGKNTTCQPTQCPTVNGTCPVCQDCTSVALQCTESLRGCQDRYTALEGSCKTSCPVVSPTQCPSVTEKDAEIGRLTQEVSSLNNRIATLTSNSMALNESLKKATSDLTNATTCESCTLWKIGFVALLALIILAWIVAL
jgi:outer membrane murein-binding lipoprotein Lpp